ncbi:MAG: hypothetical protein ACREVO_10535 [Steroidobacteraceae bacterium]
MTHSAIGIVACALADMTHEALGHVTVAWLLGVRITVLATVGMQTIGSSRLVSAAGTMANLLVGVLALVLFTRIGRRTNWTLFLWLFAAFNLMNSAYLVFSALAQSGDWMTVISALHPSWAWRCLLGLAGVILYSASVSWLARSMSRLVLMRQVALAELHYLVLSAYLSGGAIMTLASVFNPFSPKLILISGIGASYVISAGLLFIPSRVKRRVAAAAEIELPENSAAPTSPSISWVAAAIVVGLIFVAVFGPGIHFHH